MIKERFIRNQTLLPFVPQPLPSDSAKPLCGAELRLLIARYLPVWLNACDAEEGDSIVLHEASFGTSTDELFLLACAIKYAAAKGKHVHVSSGTGSSKHQPETMLPSATLGSVYRENTASKRPAFTRRRRPKRAKPKK
jgi:hypothetical protein